jgi:hypothetical protein
MQSLGRKRTKNAGCQATHYLNCPVLPYIGFILSNFLFWKKYRGKHSGKQKELYF